jgi:hypothetical protein
VRFDSTTGKLVQNSGVTISDANLLTTTDLTVNDDTTLGSSNTDTVNFNARVASDINPSTDNTYDLGVTGHEWRNLNIDGTANIDSLVADTADIDGGTIDGTAIGGSTAAAGAFTTLGSSSTTTLNGTTIPASSTLLVSGGALGTPSGGTVTNLTGTASININGTVGATTPAAGTFTTLADSIGDVRLIPQNSQSTAYTAVLTDSGKHLLHPSADTTARTFTIPANGSVAYPIGTAITFVNQASAGVMTIAITTDTMRLAGAGTTGSRTLAANGIATCLKLTATEWIISGTGLT